MITLYEIGDSLQTLATKARNWFIENNIKVPEGAAAWGKCTISRKEVPPGCTRASITRYGMNLTEFIAEITLDNTKKAYNIDPITALNIESKIGLKWISSVEVNKHKNVTVSCTKCNREEILTYGTLQRMKASSNKYCRYCRDAGGKRKDIEVYNNFTGFTPVGEVSDSRLHYKCHTCSSTIERTLTHVTTAEYLVCEYCNPRSNFGARIYTELGYFDSKIEYNAYLILLKYFSKDSIIRQKPYNELFNTGTKHTADFYIKTIDLVLEVTSINNKIGQKYKDTAEWKKSLSSKVIFAYSLKEVEDIVRPLAKALGVTVANRRDVLCRGPKR